MAEHPFMPVRTSFHTVCLAVAPLHHGASRCTMEHHDATGVTTPRQTVKASPHRHKWMLSHGAPADPSDPWNSHASPVSPRQNGHARGSVNRAALLSYSAQAPEPRL